MSNTRGNVNNPPAIDIRKHMPWYYLGIPEFDALARAQNEEYGILLERDGEQMADAYVVTADEAATTRRERELYIRADRTSEDLPFRRKRIINRYTLKPPFTLRWLEGHLEQLLEGAFEVERSADARELRIIIQASDWPAFREFLYTLEVTAPLNMGLRLTKRSQGEGAMPVGAARLGRTHHTHALPRRGIPGEAALYMGAVRVVKRRRMVSILTRQSVHVVQRLGTLGTAAGTVYASEAPPAEALFRASAGTSMRFGAGGIALGSAGVREKSG